jgi:hypothetical protein
MKPLALPPRRRDGPDNRPRRELRRVSATQPPPPPGLIGTVGDKGVKSLLDMVMTVNRGEMDRDSGSNTAMTVYGMDFNDAPALFPK